MKSGSLLSTEGVGDKLVYRSSGRTNRQSQNIRAMPKTTVSSLNTVCPYYTMFPLEFPLRRLAKAQKNAWVLDPFCGRGTTLFAARLLGLGCAGIDSNPTAAAIAAAKLSSASPKAVIDLTRLVLEEKGKPDDVPSGEFWRLCYHPKTLADLCALREYLLEKCRSSEEITLRALLLGILHGPLRKGKPTYLSNQMPRTYATKPNSAVRFWKRRNMTEPSCVDVLDTVSRRARLILSRKIPPGRGAVYFGDARRARSLLPGKRKFDWIITSPPYFKMQTYRPDQWLRNWFLGGEDAVDYDSGGQLSHHADGFVGELSTVWRSVARLCAPQARLIVRFGCLPSVPVDTKDMLRKSVTRADAGWRIYRWADAGSASSGNRQSRQFRSAPGEASREIDMYARLEA